MSKNIVAKSVIEDIMTLNEDRLNRAWNKLKTLKDHPLYVELLEAYESASLSLDYYSIGQFKNFKEHAHVTKHMLTVLKEDMELTPGNTQKMASDSVDLALDSHFRKVVKTLDGSDLVNSQAAKADPSEDTSEPAKKKFSASGFANSIAQLVDNAQVVLDFNGTVARRAYNYVRESYGTAAALDFLEVLSNNYGIEASPDSDAEGERNANNPPAIGAGPSGTT